MLELDGDLWHYHKQGEWVTITTNGNRNGKGLAVMGRGIAVQAARRFPDLKQKLGAELKRTGNFPKIFPEYHLLTLPTKQNWWMPSDLKFVVYQVENLVQAVNDPCDYWMRRDVDIEPLWEGCTVGKDISEKRLPKKINRLFMVRPGCSNGGLKWEVVKEHIKNLLDDRFIVLNPHI